MAPDLYAARGPWIHRRQIIDDEGDARVLRDIAVFLAFRKSTMAANFNGVFLWVGGFGRK